MISPLFLQYHTEKQIFIRMIHFKEKHCYAHERSPHHDDLGFPITEIMWQQSYIAASS